MQQNIFKACEITQWNSADFFAVEKHGNERPVYWSLEDFSSDLSSESSEYFIESDSRGLSAFCVFRQFDGEVEVFNWSVRDKGEKKGQTFFKSFLEAMKNAGARRILLEVGHLNLAAIRIYEKLAFHKIAERAKYYKSGEDALIYALNI